jgi:hypothetical protein
MMPHVTPPDAADVICEDAALESLLTKTAQFAVLDDRYPTQRELDDLSATINLFLDGLGISDPTQRKRWATEILKRLESKIAVLKTKSGNAGSRA